MYETDGRRFNTHVRVHNSFPVKLFIFPVMLAIPLPLHDGGGVGRIVALFRGLLNQFVNCAENEGGEVGVRICKSFHLSISLGPSAVSCR